MARRAPEEAEHIMGLDPHALAVTIEVAPDGGFGIAVADAGETQLARLALGVPEDLAGADHAASPT
jgi:hypothetical protein